MCGQKDYRAYFDGLILSLNFKAFNNQEAKEIAFAHETLKVRSIYLIPDPIKIYGEN
jgi:hypothetical protein